MNPLIEFIAKVEADIHMYSQFDEVGQTLVNEAYGIIELECEARKLLEAFDDQQMVQEARRKAAAKWESVWSEDGQLVPPD